MRYELTIDDASGTISGGQTIQQRVKPGSHQIMLETSGAGGKRIVDDFDITSGQTIEYEIGFSGWSGAKLTRVR